MGEAETLISGTPVVGLIGHAAAQLQENNTLLAAVLRVAWIDRNALAPATAFTGKVTALDVTHLPKTITVETEDPAMTYTVRLMPNSRVHQEKGLLMVGATVHVIGWQYDLGQVIASEVTVLESPEEGGEFKSFVGEIKSLPADGVLGEWTIGDQLDRRERANAADRRGAQGRCVGGRRRREARGRQHPGRPGHNLRPASYRTVTPQS